ncbi:MULTISPECIES: flagellar hook-basal body complex protein FliE [Paenarthrobacter]|jgi:flagellar hook-basal body complex protein FliE|uniref:flagellar hook-basal body complex protein FliE n=1 Tax=Paenarthrobacter TaxID=1742992 RepID=UPI00074D4244|nr:flagellar hook-basal body complex protein FliE [Paenarthrobacter ureafaciens]AMB39490.1 flagellar hook-basal body protein FliE [Arthrobacter sp. ATCC 21022]KUR64644.1 flagellar hook-basal body protein FliE [Arthrobacter sp. ATCC 21022]MBN9130895.1 flagellar hook-basal body complex protein FliE [Paenarthrobacter ureafaciens]MCX8454266.1 flagellar hook-basal body complex protein FliE [Paenarthrobacter ureafaciens]MCY0972472.1 flagellar hook-basal body complex protein FliE [Paenarthrobacter ur
MSLSPIESVQGVSGTGYVGSTKAPGSTGGGFGTALTGAVDDLQSLQSTSKELAVSAVTGNLDDIHKATLAATRAQVTFELVAAVRNKGIDAFNEIMRMQA